MQKGGGAAALAPLVAFYSKLPKGRAPAPALRGIKERWFNGRNASGAPLLALIVGVFVAGYTLDYQSASFSRACARCC